MAEYLFFDNASTTRCCDSAAELVQLYASERYGNPSSAHALGQEAARAIRDARTFFADCFEVEPRQVIFTGSGSEADNLAVYGVAVEALIRSKGKKPAPRVLTSAVEHPAVRKTVQSLVSLGIDAQTLPVDSRCQIDEAALARALEPQTCLVTIQHVNNIVGAILPVARLAETVKARCPGAVFHTDAVQAFGKIRHVTSESAVDLVSISGHKIRGPKGIGALIVLRKELLKSGFRPLVWGGEQEGGFRSGTQNAGLIAGFHAAAREFLAARERHERHARALRERLRADLTRRGLLGPASGKNGSSAVRWNSPDEGIPHIVNLSVPGYPSAPLAKLLEERGCLVSTGSACSSQKIEPDLVLKAMGLPEDCQGSAVRISFGEENRPEDVDRLAGALDESIQLMCQLLRGGVTA